MTTFLAYCERKAIQLISYSCEAEGVLEFTDGKYRFTMLILRPKITVGSEESRNAVAGVLQSAHDNCIIANSIRSEVLMQPVISVDRGSPSELRGGG